MLSFNDENESNIISQIDKDNLIYRARPAAFIEMQKWIENVTKKTFPYNEDFRRSLSDGILLCNLLNALKTGSIKRINKVSSPMAGYEGSPSLDNIGKFLRVCHEDFGLSSRILFETSDLEDLSDREKDMSLESERRLLRVLICLFHLAKSVENHLTDVTLDPEPFGMLLQSQDHREMSRIKCGANSVDRSQARDPHKSLHQGSHSHPVRVPQTLKSPNVNHEVIHGSSNDEEWQESLANWREKRRQTFTSLSFDDNKGSQIEGQQLVEMKEKARKMKLQRDQMKDQRGSLPQLGDQPCDLRSQIIPDIDEETRAMIERVKQKKMDDEIRRKQSVTLSHSASFASDSEQSTSTIVDRCEECDWNRPKKEEVDEVSPTVFQPLASAPSSLDIHTPNEVDRINVINVKFDEHQKETHKENNQNTDISDVIEVVGLPLDRSQDDHCLAGQEGREDPQNGMDKEDLLEEGPMTSYETHHDQPPFENNCTNLQEHSKSVDTSSIESECGDNLPSWQTKNDATFKFLVQDRIARFESQNMVIHPRPDPPLNLSKLSPKKYPSRIEYSSRPRNGDISEPRSLGNEVVRNIPRIDIEHLVKESKRTSKTSEELSDARSHIERELSTHSNDNGNTSNDVSPLNDIAVASLLQGAEKEPYVSPGSVRPQDQYSLQFPDKDTLSSTVGSADGGTNINPADHVVSNVRISKPPDRGRGPKVPRQQDLVIENGDVHHSTLIKGPIFPNSDCLASTKQVPTSSQLFPIRSRGLLSNLNDEKDVTPKLTDLPPAGNSPLEGGGVSIEKRFPSDYVRVTDLDDLISSGRSVLISDLTVPVLHLVKADPSKDQSHAERLPKVKIRKNHIYNHFLPTSPEDMAAKSDPPISTTSPPRKVKPRPKSEMLPSDRPLPPKVETVKSNKIESIIYSKKVKKSCPSVESLSESKRSISDKELRFKDCKVEDEDNRASSLRTDPRATKHGAMVHFFEHKSSNSLPSSISVSSDPKRSSPQISEKNVSSGPNTDRRLPLKQSKSLSNEAICKVKCNYCAALIECGTAVDVQCKSPLAGRASGEKVVMSQSKSYCAPCYHKIAHKSNHRLSASNSRSCRNSETSSHKKETEI